MVEWSIFNEIFAVAFNVLYFVIIIGTIFIVDVYKRQYLYRYERYRVSAGIQLYIHSSALEQKSVLGKVFWLFAVSYTHLKQPA